MFGTPGSVRVYVRFEGAVLAALLMIATPAPAASAVTMAPRPAVAQNTGTISGTVIDNTSQVVPGATVTLTNESTASARTHRLGRARRLRFPRGGCPDRTPFGWSLPDSEPPSGAITS